MARGFRAALPGEWFFPLPCARHTRLPAIASPTSACARRCSFSPGGAPGVHSCPSQGCSRVRVVAPRELRGGRIALRAIPAAFLSDRAHVPFSPDPPRVPIDFRRDDRPPVGNTCESKRRSIGGCRGVDFWASTPVCGPILPAHVRPGDRSCLGLCLLQGWRAHGRASRAGSTPLRITGPRGSTAHLDEWPRRIPYPLMGLRRPSRQR
jgi:hypothetical protein